MDRVIVLLEIMGKTQKLAFKAELVEALSALKIALEVRPRFCLEVPGNVAGQDRVDSHAGAIVQSTNGTNASCAPLVCLWCPALRTFDYTK
jgi:hypothetical protein